MTTATLGALERRKDQYGAGCVEAKLELLRRLARADLRSARAVRRLHEVLCFLRAYPDDARLLAQVDGMLARFHLRTDLRRARAALADSGIAGTAIRYRFFWSTLRWLAQRWPQRLVIDRSETEVADRLAAALPLILTWADAATLKLLDPPAFAAIDRLRGRGEGAAAFLVRRIAAMPGDGFTREAFHDAIEASYELEPGSDTPARTRARHTAAPFSYQREPLRRARPDLREELGRLHRAVRLVSPREGEQLIELARSAMVTRSRDLDAFAYGNAHDVRLVDDGGGLGFALIGVTPERRALVPATCGYLILHNGVPIGYGEAFAIGRSATMTFNIFESFRGGEAAHTFARTLAMVRHVFGAESFSLDQYQLGKGNDEAIASGAWRWTWSGCCSPSPPTAAARSWSSPRTRAGCCARNWRACAPTRSTVRAQARCAPWPSRTCYSISTGRARPACRRSPSRVCALARAWQNWQGVSASACWRNVRGKRCGLPACAPCAVLARASVSPGSAGVRSSSLRCRAWHAGARPKGAR